MRWIFAETLEEKKHRIETEEKIVAWWLAFEQKSPEIKALFARKGPDFGLSAWMEEHLGSIHPMLAWEYAPAVRTQGHRLVITPESRHALRPLVSTLLERAPKLAGWEFYEYRLAESVSLAQSTVEGRTGVNISGWLVKVQREGKAIDLGFLIPQEIQENTSAATFITTESLLGEKILEEWIGRMSFSPLDSDTNDWEKIVPLDRLYNQVSGLLQEIAEELPKKPLHQMEKDEEHWLSFTLKPKEAQDYPGLVDMFVGSSCVPGLAEAVRSTFFASTRFSRCGETFCYLKIDGQDGLADSSFADRVEIEDALDEALRANQYGCAIGGGTGLRYSYVDLAVVDLPRSIAVIREVLRAGNIPQRTWLLFYDSSLATEWVGIYPDVSAPPQWNME